MQLPDYIVLGVYFLAMFLIGLWAMRRIKSQEDYFLGGRAFGKVLQAFAAFGVGTGSADPVNTARTCVTGGMSGMWSVMSWLFVTPFYWITGVWYRRMRRLTLGDWFVDRYESRALGVAYTVFGLLFYMVYTSMLFSAVGKVAAPLFSGAMTEAFPVRSEYALVLVVAVIVIVYGVLGGLTAAYWTDFIQGLCIIFLSIILIPFGLDALVQQFGNPETQGMMDGFGIMHQQLPASMFKIIGSTNASEFPFHRILAVTLISLVGVVVMPHFIATGGGSAKSELNARVGLVAGNLAKRFCTIGWALTALIVLALFADHPELVADPDKTWGIASRELLSPGLRGLMMACMLAALMSSADCYMLVCSALVVRHIYTPYINANASEKECVRVGRISGVLVIMGAVIVSWTMMDVFAQLQLTWIVPMLFAAPFWVGMFWRRATTTATWVSVGFTALAFFIIPWLIPQMLPDLRTLPRWTQASQVVTRTLERSAAPSDLRKRQLTIQQRQREKERIERALSGRERQAALEGLGHEPLPLSLGSSVKDTFRSGGMAIYWSEGVVPVNQVRYKEVDRQESEGQLTVYQEYDCELLGQGNFKLDFLFYDLIGVNLETKSDAALKSMELLPKIVAPFLVMILVSLISRRNSAASLDRFYVEMKTPVAMTPEEDQKELTRSYQKPDRFDHLKMFPGSDLEMTKPSLLDVIGFVASFVVCGLIVVLAIWVAGIGAP